VNTKSKFSFGDFEAITENSEKKLLGGFSASISLFSTQAFGIDGSNNCNGGNCVEGCGNGSNVSCNTVQGCGKG